jgi:phytanoyl-CoA hydroxylase
MHHYDALRDDFERDGFVIIPGLLDSQALAELQSQIDRYIRDVVPTLPQDAAFFTDYSRPETLCKIQSLQRHDPWFRQMNEQGSHRPLLEHFLRDGFAPQALEWFDKLPGAGGTPPHQDGFYWCRKPNIACGLWIALEAATIDNGCLWYARGSHQAGVHPHAPSGVLGFSQGVVGFDRQAADAVPIELGPGDAVAHHAATIHWTDANRTQDHRRALSIFCFGASTVLDEEAHARYHASLASQLKDRGIDVDS